MIRTNRKRCGTPCLPHPCIYGPDLMELVHGYALETGVDAELYRGPEFNHRFLNNNFLLPIFKKLRYTHFKIDGKSIRN